MITNDNSYFSVPHAFTVYLESWSEKNLPDDDQLKAMHTTGLKLINEVKELEQQSISQIKQFNEAGAVLDYLQIHAKKIDLVLQYLLEQQPHKGKKFQGQGFGGSRFDIITSSPMKLNSLVKSTLYIREELISVFCISRVISNVEQGNHFITNLEYASILDTDIEQLVQASLHIQQKQIKSRKLAQKKG